jgi:hypothetical protein
MAVDVRLFKGPPLVMKLLQVLRSFEMSAGAMDAYVVREGEVRGMTSTRREVKVGSWWFGMEARSAEQDRLVRGTTVGRCEAQQPDSI